ncbi:uncharacterized protein [Rhodnius prolixus]|uniref:uncharacterized protein n=1 Tax=Rhodnius prolixus TaxID=13249 RepID=UPI003D18B021
MAKYKFKLSLILVIWLYNSPQISAYPRFIINHPLTTTPTSTEKTSNIDTTRSVTVQHVSNYSISLVPLVSRILNMIPKIINKITQFQRNSSQQVKAFDDLPPEFSGANPCLDSILSTRQYPGSSCHFYQCVTRQPSSIKCLLKVIEDSAIGGTSINAYKLNIAMSSFVTSVQIDECLSIRIFKCLPGYTFNRKSNTCLRNTQNFEKFNICGTT